SAELKVISAKLGTTPADYKRYLTEEKDYLERLKSELEEVSLWLEYLDSLQELDEALHRANTSSVEHERLNIKIAAKRIRGAAITAVKNRYRNAWKKLEDAEAHMVALEERLAIEERWTLADPAYQEAMSEMTMRRYCLALDKLERLVVQRLLEFSKLSMGG
ncbi:hypothetical protein BC835DRAFT_1284859, partial [Cytidiella melzeri]